MGEVLELFAPPASSDLDRGSSLQGHLPWEVCQGGLLGLLAPTANAASQGIPQGIKTANGQQE